MNPLEALMMPVGDDEQMKALARSLRGRQTAADFFSASSIPQLQQMAQTEQQYIKDVGERQGVLREALERRKLDQQQHEDMKKYRADELAQRGREAEQYNALRLTLGQLKESENGYVRPQTRQEREDFDKGDKEAVGVMTLLSTFKPEYASTVPYTGKIKNIIGRNFEELAPEAYKDQAQWWSAYTGLTQEQLHEMFGAALTKTELARWEAATITPQDGDEFIKEKLAIQSGLINKWTERKAALALNRGYDPNEVLMNYGSTVDVPSLQERVSDGSYFKELAELQAADLAGTDGSAPGGDSEEYQEGDIVEDANGNQLILRNGQWEQHQ